MNCKPDERNIGYCQGFVDGYNDGIRDNSYDGSSFDTDELFRHLQYKIGYDAGVAVYCREKHPEDEE
jgi:hypothetical protein